jgi:hypothetical protein
MSFPPLLPVDEIRERLLAIFPDGIPNRQHIIKPNTARVVFCSLYTGAVEGTDRWFAPRHLYRMTEKLSVIEDPEVRTGFYKGSYRVFCWYRPYWRQRGEPLWKQQPLMLGSV